MIRDRRDFRDHWFVVAFSQKQALGHPTRHYWKVLAWDEAVVMLKFAAARLGTRMANGIMQVNVYDWLHTEPVFENYGDFFNNPPINAPLKERTDDHG